MPDLSVGFEPVGADSGGNFEGDSATVGIGHIGSHYLLETGEFAWSHVEDEFVMNLHYHTRAETGFFDVAVDVDHRQFDDVGSGALQRGIDGVTFGITAHYRVARIDVGEVAFASHKGRDKSTLFRALDLLVYVFADVGIAGEVTVNELLSLGAWDTQAFRQSECRYAVDDAEVGSLGIAAHVVGQRWSGVYPHRH